MNPSYIVKTANIMERLIMRSLSTMNVDFFQTGLQYIIF